MEADPLEESVWHGLCVEANLASRTDDVPSVSRQLRGGANFKRGDIEYELRDCEPEFDVHMASSGHDMDCIACHVGEDHRVRGRGTDLSGSDMPHAPLTCDNGECHGESPHSVGILNHHARRVYCPVCHIPSFAKTDATDMSRDWSATSYNAQLDKYTADIRLEKDVKPVMAWYNGDVWEQLPATRVEYTKSGEVGMMLPQGSREDTQARLFAFKLHRGRMPVLKEKGWIIPIVVEKFFADGDIDAAIRNAAREVYGLDDIEYSWADTVRYMGIFHEVQPASKALGCLECHSPEGRLNWKELGYEADPLERLVAGQKNR